MKGSPEKSESKVAVVVEECEAPTMSVSSSSAREGNASPAIPNHSTGNSENSTNITNSSNSNNNEEDAEEDEPKLVVNNSCLEFHDPTAMRSNTSEKEKMKQQLQNQDIRRHHPALDFVLTSPPTSQRAVTMSAIESSSHNLSLSTPVSAAVLSSRLTPPRPGAFRMAVSSSAVALTSTVSNFSAANYHASSPVAADNSSHQEAVRPPPTSALRQQSSSAGVSFFEPEQASVQDDLCMVEEGSTTEDNADTNHHSQCTTQNDSFLMTSFTPLDAELVDLPTATPAHSQRSMSFNRGISALTILTAKPVGRIQRAGPVAWVLVALLSIVGIVGLVVGLKNRGAVAAEQTFLIPPPFVDRRNPHNPVSTLAAMWKANWQCQQKDSGGSDSASLPTLELVCPPQSTIEILGTSSSRASCTQLSVASPHIARCVEPRSDGDIDADGDGDTDKDLHSVVYFACHRRELSMNGTGTDGDQAVDDSPIEARVFADPSCQPIDELAFHYVTLTHFCISAVEYANDLNNPNATGTLYLPRESDDPSDDGPSQASSDNTPSLTESNGTRRRVLSDPPPKPPPPPPPPHRRIEFVPISFKDTWRENTCVRGTRSYVRTGEALDNPRAVIACFTATPKPGTNITEPSLIGPMASTQLANLDVCRHKESASPDLALMQRNVTEVNKPAAILDALEVSFVAVLSGISDEEETEPVVLPEMSSTHGAIWQTDVGNACPWEDYETTSIRIDCPRASHLRVWNTSVDVLCDSMDTDESYTHCTRDLQRLSSTLPNSTAANSETATTTTGATNVNNSATWWNSHVLFTCTRTLTFGDAVRVTLLPSTQPILANDPGTSCPTSDRPALEKPAHLVTLIHYCLTSTTGSSVLGGSGGNNSTLPPPPSSNGTDTSAAPPPPGGDNSFNRNDEFKGIFRSNHCDGSPAASKARIRTGDSKNPRNYDVCYDSMLNPVSTYILNADSCRHIERLGPGLEDMLSSVGKQSNAAILGEGVVNMTIGVDSERIKPIAPGPI